MSEAPGLCAECAAPPVDGLTCWEQLGMLIAWEADDPELRAEHFLIVGCYNLQHPAQFTDEALANLCAALIDRLDNSIGVQELRRRASRLFEGKTRVLKRPAERRPNLRHWPMTIADVYTPEQRAGAADRVRRWAAVIRLELGAAGAP